MVVGFTIKGVSSNLPHGEVYSIQHYVVVSECHTTCRWFSSGTSISSTNKTDHHDIIEILLNISSNTITPEKYMYHSHVYLNKIVVLLLIHKG